MQDSSPVATANRKPARQLGFGKLFTQHMARMDYDPDQGWHDLQVTRYGPLSLDPAAAVLHYGQAVFEGLKAFLGDDGQVRMFRLESHAARFRASCEHLCIPLMPRGTFREAVGQVVHTDLDEVPPEDGASLYIRPLVFASEAFLGVRPASRYTFLVMLSPVGAYYAKGFAPVRIWVERRAVRAAPGGLGAAKTAANYAASLEAAHLAKERGYDQVLWTDALTHTHVEEVGTMNLFVHLNDEIVTPPLEGTILPGITRDSVIQLLRDRGAPIVERRLSVDEIRAAHDAGDLHEVFGTGTAAVVSPVGELGFEDGDRVVGDGGVGPMARDLYTSISAIQRGRAPDPHGWTRIVD